jgi:hypothetical protein
MAPIELCMGLKFSETILLTQILEPLFISFNNSEDTIAFNECLTGV